MTTSSYLENGPLDGEVWDLTGWQLEARLEQHADTRAGGLYLETTRRTPEGLTIWTYSPDRTGY